MLINFYYRKLGAEQKKVYGELLYGMQSRKSEIFASAEPSEKILDALSFEHPELYYVDFSNISFERSVFEIRVTVNYKNKTQEEQIKASIQNIISHLKLDNNETIIRSLHNYFVKNIKYDFHDMVSRENHSIVGPLLYGKAVCEGIAKTVQYILNILGIDNTVIIGSNDGGSHMWNVVNINGFNYHMDVTGDINLTEKRWNKPGYFYYLLTDEEILKTHEFSESFNCYSKIDNPFYTLGKTFYDLGQLADYIKSQSGNQNLLYFKFIGKKTPDEILNIVSMNWKTFSVFGTRLYMVNAVGTYYIWR